jgi:hypothetical protein
MRDMQNAAVLHAGPGAYPDAMHVPADGDMWPDGNIICQNDVSENHGAGIDKHAMSDSGRFSLEAAQVEWIVVSHWPALAYS